MVSRKSVFAAISAVFLATLGSGAKAAHAQSVPYLTSTWPPAFGSNLTSDPSTSAFGKISSRYNFDNGWFVGSERGGLGFGINGFSQGAAFGNPSFSYEGTQVGYTFKSAPVSVYAGFDTLKYNPGIGALPGFDSLSSSTVPGYSAHAGVEFRPTSNLSLSVGVGFAQQPAGIDGGINSLVTPGASPFVSGARH
jgi:opacity protein-like surface antigen